MQQTLDTKGIEVRNWEGSIVSYPQVVVRPRNIDDIVAILKDPERYPAPVRAIGSNHSTTRCATAEGGTVVDMSGMNRIIEIGPDYVTAEAGAEYIDVAKKLEENNLQFFVNIELGNLTIGSACSGGTKDASMPGEFGQVCSYAIGIKIVTPAGERIEVTEDQPDLLQAMRSSYGLLGIVYEATFRVQPLQAMSVHHETYSLDRFNRELPDLIARGESMMLYIYPFLNSITVEYRRYVPSEGSPNRMVWRMRNWTWKSGAPTLGYLCSRYIPFKPIQSFILNGFNRMVQVALKAIVKSGHTVPTDQLIRYPKKAGKSKYTFSIWAFPEREYPTVLREYVQFCRGYYRDHGYRCDLLNVGYRIRKDQSSLFSYSYDGDVLTIDPVSTAAEGWEDFLKAYNQFCSDHGGVPLFNQTGWIEPYQAKKAFGSHLTKFEEYRKQYDPGNRLLNRYFADMIE